MVDYRRMGIMEEQLLNTTSTISSHRLRDLWESPRGTVLRIQALAMVAIIFSFFLASYGSCRRWSNSWIVQKGFFAAQALSLSLGTYSIGLMQSSSVTSEMYPIWTVSLFTLFGCIDPVTTYNGLDYKGQLSKVVFGIFLQCGYVLLMSISTISNVVGNTAIGILSVITLIKGFHRSLSLVQQRRMRTKVQSLLDGLGHGYVLKNDPSIETIQRDSMVVSFATGIEGSTDLGLSQVEDALPPKSKGHKDEWLWSCYDECVAMSLSHHLQRHVLGLGYRKPRPEKLKGTNYEWALKVIEIELALLYDYYYTGNPFIHYYQAKTASLWALASFIGICFVGVAAAIPGTMTSRHHTNSGSGGGGCTNVVNTTTADLVVTFVILVLLALLQLMQLIRSWTSNWARVAIASMYATNLQKVICGAYETPWWWARWMRLKAFVATSSNWFDKYLWQDKIGQYSVLPEGRITAGENGEGSSAGKECKSPVSSSRITMTAGKNGEGSSSTKECKSPVSSSTTYMTVGNNVEAGSSSSYRSSSSSSSRKESKPTVTMLASMVGFLYKQCARLVMTLGLDYIWEVLWDLLGSDTNKRPAIRLDDEVKKSVIGFLDKIETDRLDGNWLSFSEKHPSIDIGSFIPSPEAEEDPHGYRYTKCVMKLHIATWYCEIKEQGPEKQEQKPEKQEQEPKQEDGSSKENRNRHVANVLSKYCVYLVESAPELLPGPAPETKRAYDNFKKAARIFLGKDDKDSRWFFFGRRKHNKDRFLGALSDPDTWTGRKWEEEHFVDPGFLHGLDLGKKLMGLGDDSSCRSDPWGTLVHVWVRLLVYAAPYGNVEMHMRRLSQGGEFITHLWTLLYHLDIREWKASPHNLRRITTTADAQAILAEDRIKTAVVAFINSESILQRDHSDEFANASKLEPLVKFYETSSPDVAKLFHIDPASRNKALICFLNKRAEQKFTLYDGIFNAYRIAYFATTAKTRAQGTAPTVSDNAIRKQIIEDGGQTEDQISANKLA